MNILLTSVGRRAYMVKYFKEAVGKNGSVHVCNSNADSVAFLYADYCFVSPIIYCDDYIPFLLEYCVKNKIDAIVSLFDIDLLVLSKHKQDFLRIGTRVIVSDEKVISICNDKWQTFNYLKKLGLKVPKTFLSEEEIIKALNNNDVSFPIVVKPRFGCGSISVSVADDMDDLLYLIRHNKKIIEKSYLRFESDNEEEKLIFQEYLNGQEYGADIINDLNGNYILSNIRKKLAMRSGETDIAEIVWNDNIEKGLSLIGNDLKHVGNMDVDIFIVNNEPYILEMNARFGGGYPFCHFAGCNLPKAIISWLKNEKVENDLLESDVGIKVYKELNITGYNENCITEI